MRELSVEVEAVTTRSRRRPGVASTRDDGQAVEELVAKAATTMYTARASGKGQVAFFSVPDRP